MSRFWRPELIFSHSRYPIAAIRRILAVCAPMQLSCRPSPCCLLNQTILMQNPVRDIWSWGKKKRLRANEYGVAGEETIIYDINLRRTEYFCRRNGDGCELLVPYFVDPQSRPPRVFARGHPLRPDENPSDRPPPLSPKSRRAGSLAWRTASEPR